jgi:hypothetical protein
MQGRPAPCAPPDHEVGDRRIQTESACRHEGPAIDKNREPLRLVKAVDRQLHRQFGDTLGPRHRACPLFRSVRPTLGDAGADWVCAYWRGDNWDYARRCPGRMKRPIGYGYDDIGFVANHCLRQLRHLLRRADAKINDQIVAFDEAARRYLCECSCPWVAPLGTAIRFKNESLVVGLGQSSAFKLGIACADFRSSALSERSSIALVTIAPAKAAALCSK